MTFATAIQTFAGAHTGLGNTNNAQSTPDWTNGLVYIHSTSSNPGDNGGFVSQSALVGGAELGYATLSSLSDANYHVNARPPSALAASGNLFMSGNDGIFMLDTVSWIRGDTWGKYTSAMYPFGPPAPPISIGANDAVIQGTMCGVTSPSNNFVYGTGLGSVSPLAHNTFLCNLPTFTYQFTWPGRTKATCSGASGSGDFFLICGNRDPVLGFFPLNLYKMTVTDGGAVTNTLLYSYNPTDIDAAWTNVESTSMGFDQTDGTLLAFVVGQVGAANRYLIKFDATTGAVIWQTIIPGGGNLPGAQMAYSNIFGGKYCFIVSGSPNTIYTFDTSVGTYTTQTTGVGGLTVFGPQCFDAHTGIILTNLNWSASVDGPTPLGGSSPFFSGWAAIYVTTGVIPPPAPGTPGGPATSRKKAWTFTLDGHEFYVLDLGQEGTWCYDRTTQTWMNFYTMAYVQWDVCNGVMWGDRIVGGDLATTDIWECAVSTVTDNGLYDIPHTVTGGLAVRSRSAVGCAAVLLSASLGDLYDVTGSAMQMRYSDDNGETWTAYDAIAMVQGDFKTELRWRSLGSFAAPGRVFEFYDVGGPRSISGCDAFLDDFDQEKQPDLTEPQ